MTIEKFDGGTLQKIAKIIGEMFKGLEIQKILKEANIDNISQNSTKWRIIEDCLIAKQYQDGCANNILNFVKITLSPTRNIDNQNYNNNRLEINEILSFKGLEIKPNGEIGTIEKSTTISDAKKRVNNLRKKLTERNTHNDIFTYCGDEIETENYFHVVFEATKGIFDKIRKRTGLKSDGANLIDEVFSFEKSNPLPYLALNRLSTESEQSEQKGFMNLLKGIYGTFRNPLGHEVKIEWDIKEEDALDILSLISLVNRRIDNAIEAKGMMENR
jgi:uncharacterized protein (TIGR02391 family)